MHLEVNWQRPMPRDQRARCHIPRKTPMWGHFASCTSNSDGTADCHTQRRSSCASCFRSRTCCNACALILRDSDGSLLYHAASLSDQQTAEGRSRYVLAVSARDCSRMINSEPPHCSFRYGCRVEKSAGLFGDGL